MRRVPSAAVLPALLLFLAVATAPAIAHERASRGPADVAPGVSVEAFDGSVASSSDGAREPAGRVVTRVTRSATPVRLPATPLVIALAALIGAAAIPRGRRGALAATVRHGTALVLAALILFVAFESSIHSTHHVNAADDARCVIASAVPHLMAISVEPVAVSLPAVALDDVRPDSDRLDPLQRAFANPDGRAPPARPSRLA
jgi:hypothetical protein